MTKSGIFFLSARAIAPGGPQRQALSREGDGARVNAKGLLLLGEPDRTEFVRGRASANAHAVGQTCPLIPARRGSNPKGLPCYPDSRVPRERAGVRRAMIG